MLINWIFVTAAFGIAESVLKVSPTNSVVELNNKISFFCQTSLNATIMWKANGKSVSQSRYVVQHSKDGWSTLRIEPILIKDNQSSISCHVKKDLTEKFDISSASAVLTVLDNKHLPSGYPSIIDDPRLKAVERNHSATMTCQVKGDPPPKLLWLKNYFPVNMSNRRYSIATLGNPGSLVIQNSDESDEGKYECVARNEKGVVHSRSAHLYVKIRRVPPQFSIRPTSVYRVMLGGKLEMSCVAFGHPMPRVFWRRTSTGQNLHVPEMAPVGKNVLVLNDVQRNDNFTCIAFSVLGNIEAETEVVVKASPNPPDIIKILNVTSHTVTVGWSYFVPFKQQDDDLSQMRRHIVVFRKRYSNEVSFSDGKQSMGNWSVVEGLRPYTEYEFRVHAIVDIGRGEPSLPIQATTLEALPETPPKNVQSRSLSGSNIVVQWDLPEKANGRILSYRIFYNNKEVENYSKWPYKDVSEGRITQISDLIPEQLYTIYVAARNSIGYGPVSDSVLVYTKTGIPGQPINLNASAAGPNEISLMWQRPLHPEALSYKIKYNWTDSDDVIISKMGEVDVVGPITQYKLTKLKPNTEYSFRILAKSPRGEGVPSSMVNARTGLSVPGPPRHVQETLINETTVLLNWEEPSDRNGPVSGFFVDLDELDKNNQFVFQKPIRNFVNEKHLTLHELKPNTNYSVRVSAYNSKGDGVVSKARIFKSIPSKPMPPKNVVVDLINHVSSDDQRVSGLSLRPIEVRVRWEAPENLKTSAQLYMLKYKAKDDEKFIEIPVQNTTHYEISDLKYNENYEFRIAALYDGQYSDEAWNSILTPIGTPIVPPPNVRYEYSLQDRTLYFTWEEIPAQFSNGNITRYKAFLEGGRAGPITKEFRTTKATYRDISPVTRYRFKVQAGTVRDFGPWSNEIIVEPAETDQYLVEILELTAMSETEAGIRWKTLDDPKVQGYRVRYTRESSHDSWQHIDNKNRSHDHLFIDNLRSRATYQFCVQALIDEKKIGECASHRSLELRPIFVVRDLDYELIEPKVVRLTWTYDGPEPAKFFVRYDLSKTFRMLDGNRRDINFEVKVKNVSETQLDVSGLRFYTNYTFKVSVIYDGKLYLPQRKRLTTNMDVPSTFDPPQIVDSNSNVVRLKLKAASDENGPIQSYWLVVAPANFSKNYTDSINNNELQNENDGAYIAAEITQSHLWSLKNQIFTIGDGQSYGRDSNVLYRNRPLKPSQRYKAFLRAFIGPPGTKNEKNFRSSHWSTDFALVTPSSTLPFIPGDSNFLWILAPITLLVIVGLLITAICMYLKAVRKRKCLSAKRQSAAKMSLIGMNGGPTETSKLLSSSNDYGNISEMPPPINGHVKPYETTTIITNNFAQDSFNDDLNQNTSTAKLKRASRNYPVPSINISNGDHRMSNSTHQPISVIDLSTHIERLKANDNFLFSREYESIETGQHFTWEHSVKDCNKPKNRYANVIAYDHSRVVLDQPDDTYSDYINANFIDGYRRPKSYIATQGPLPETFCDFWRMVWEQRSATIVMLTKLEERGRIKCDQYWPNRSSQIYGQIQVTAKDGLEFAHYTLRIFEIAKVGGNESREVKHLQFTAWPDHGVPDHPTPFLMFLSRVSALNSTDAGPIVVHCSAGVGRTGAFVVVDRALDRLRHGDSTLDVNGDVAVARAQRNYMVQTEEQYIFVHDCVLDAVQSGCTEVPAGKLYAHLQQQLQRANLEGPTGLEMEFRILSTVTTREAHFRYATLPCNKHKNRLVNILPYDSNRVCLSPLIDASEGSDYVNASFIDGYRRRKTYIATQGPLASTVADFWRMLWEHNSTIIVMLTKLRESGREKCFQYWPSDRLERYGGFTVEPIAEYNMPQYILREFKLTDHKDGQSKTVRHFQYTEWPEQGVPKSGEYFIEFIGQVHKTKEQFGQEGPITVHCSGGVGRTGAFICLSIVLERMRYEGVVDIFTTVKLLRTQRANMVQSEDQYHFCYRAALEYYGCFDHYSLQ